MRLYPHVMVVAGAFLAAASALATRQTAIAQDGALDVGAIGRVADDFAGGLTGCDAARVQGVVTAALWGRLSTILAGKSPGALGSFEVVQINHGINRAGYTTVLFLRTDPDGVEHVVSATLKLQNGTWKVCGGPGPTCPSGQ